MPKKPLLVEPDVKKPWPTLSNVLLFDPVQAGAAIYDINPFDTLILNPNPKPYGGVYRVILPLIDWPSLEAFDQAMVWLLLTAAKARACGIVDAQPDGALRLLTYGIPLQQIVLHPKTLAQINPDTKKLRVWSTEHMKPDFIIGLDYPENVGRVCGQGLHSLGAFIFNPSAVAGVRLKP